jgi:hypothetical protein
MRLTQRTTRRKPNHLTRVSVARKEGKQMAGYRLCIEIETYDGPKGDTEQLFLSTGTGDIDHIIECLRDIAERIEAGDIIPPNK